MVARQDLMLVKTQVATLLRVINQVLLTRNRPDLVLFEGPWCTNAETDIISNQGVMMATNVFLKCNICPFIYSKAHDDA